MRALLAGCMRGMALAMNRLLIPRLNMNVARHIQTGFASGRSLFNRFELWCMSIIIKMQPVLAQPVESCDVDANPIIELVVANPEPFWWRIPNFLPSRTVGMYFCVWLVICSIISIILLYPTTKLYTHNCPPPCISKPCDVWDCTCVWPTGNHTDYYCRESETVWSTPAEYYFAFVASIIVLCTCTFYLCCLGGLHCK